MIMLANAHRQIARFQHVHTAKQYERQVICYVDVKVERVIAVMDALHMLGDTGVPFMTHGRG